MPPPQNVPDPPFLPVPAGKKQSSLAMAAAMGRAEKEVVTGLAFAATSSVDDESQGNAEENGDDDAFMVELESTITELKQDDNSFWKGGFFGMGRNNKRDRQEEEDLTEEEYARGAPALDDEDL